tara:strand:- start:833 stop:1573 length:741 start_codon:yes stop_codon:yes gene_type:complete
MWQNYLNFVSLSEFMTTFTYQERFKTLKGVFDEFTNRNLFELQSRGYFDELVSPLFVGKESNVFIAKSNDKKVIIKIYRIQNCDFNIMFSYIKKDIRYQHLNKQRRQIILAWVQREYRNLIKAEHAGISSPKSIAVKNNVLVEEMIGEPALQLKDAHPENPEKFLEEIILQVRKLYKFGLIHGDLSAFNILNHQEKPYLIDFSQATLVKTPNSEELLERDIKNILQFFKKLKVKRDVQEVLGNVKG